MEKVITMAEFADELTQRLNQGKSVDCCKEELVRLAQFLKVKVPRETIRVTWKN